MTCSLRTFLVHLLVIPALAIPTPSAPRCGGGTEKDFEAALDLAHRTAGSGKWARAKEMLLGVLEEHRDAPYVLYHALEVKDAMQECAFWLSHDPPEPKDCVSGDLVSYGGASGRIDLRYSDDPTGRKNKAKLQGGARARVSRATPFAGYDFSDFVTSDEMRMHPMLFDGPFTIDFDGRAHLGEPLPMVVLCADWNQVYFVVFHSTTLHPDVCSAHVLRGAEGRLEEIASCPSPQIADVPYQLKILVNTTTITVQVRGTKLLTAKKSPDEWGSFGFTPSLGVRSVSIHGDVQASFVQNAIDGVVQKARAEFAAQYKSESDLPQWFVEKTRVRDPSKWEAHDSLPGRDDPQQHAHVERFQAAITKRPLLREGVETELARVKGLPKEEITDALRDWFTASLLELLDRDAEALEACTRLRALESTFFPARLMQMRLHASLGQNATAIQEGRELIAGDPLRSESYEMLASLELIDDKPDEARAVLHAAIDAGVPADELQSIGRTLLRCETGPAWPRVYSYTSEHYEVSSDISQPICATAATTLERFYKKFNTHLKRVGGGDKRKFRVYLFSGEAGYHAYTSELLNLRMEHTGGLYSPLVKQLLIWNLPDVEEMLRAVRHEGFHQYFDQLLPHDPPKWLNEGLAQYYEGSKIVHGGWSDGEKLPARVQTLRQTKLAPLREFLTLDGSAFMNSATVERNYAQSWALVHFLCSDKSDRRRLFDALLDALTSGVESKDALQQVFGAVDLEKLDGELARYVKEQLL